MQPPAGNRGGRLEALRARVQGCRRLSESAFEVELELERPGGLHFAAGQSISVSVNGQSRHFSPTSDPSSDRLLLLVRRIEGGAVSPPLCAAATGAEVPLAGPHGVFRFMPSDRPAVLVSTGVGIAPFLSMVRTRLLDPDRDITLLHGARSPRELFHREELQAAVARYVPCLSGEGEPGCFPGRVTAWSHDHLPTGCYDFYLCGSRHMVRDMTALVDERFPGSRVFTEIFF